MTPEQYLSIIECYAIWGYVTVICIVIWISIKLFQEFLKEKKKENNFNQSLWLLINFIFAFLLLIAQIITGIRLLDY
jgi:Ca2+/Na+ antiporter